VPADHATILYEGRSAPAPAGGVRLGFPGVTVHLRFRGPSLVLRATASSADCYFDVSVDGATPTVLRLREGPGDYALVPAGPAAEHTVTLIRRTESWQGTCALLAFDPGAGGAMLPAPELPGRKLMFIGDSITCGAMTAWTPGAANRDSAINTDARLSYGMLLARKLEAQCTLVSYGGRGLVRDWQGIQATTNAPQFYELALPDDPVARWDPRRYVPDAIGVMLGQNDFSTGIPDQVGYVHAYEQFIETLRRDAPQAVIILINSPMQSDEAGGDLRRPTLLAYLAQVVAHFNSPKVILAPVRHYAGVPGNTHPTGADHAAIAAELEPVIRRAVGW
jgi:hypothetical protein